jgi:hypothetical protein
MTSVATVARNAESEAKTILNEYDSLLDFKQRLSLYKEFSEMLYALGNAAILLENNIQKFKQYMMRTAENGREFLADGKQRGFAVPAYYNKALLGAIVAGRHDVALEIARLSSKQKSRWEYEDEYFSALFIQEYLISTLDNAYQPEDLTKVCDEIETYLEAKPAKVSFYRALLDKDVETAQESFAEWNVQYVDEVEEKQLNNKGSYWDIVNDRIWTEGLAMVILADLNDMPLDPPYKYIPGILHSISLAADQNDMILGQTA